MRAGVLVVALGLFSCAGSDSTGEGSSQLRPAEGNFITCSEMRPSLLGSLDCAVPGLTEPVCANRSEYVCVRAPCPQPWYNRCSSASACHDRQVTGYVRGACVEPSSTS